MSDQRNQLVVRIADGSTLTQLASVDGSGNLSVKVNAALPTGTNSISTTVSDRSTLSQSLSMASTSNGVALAVPGCGTATIKITGTWTGTISFEGTVDGTNYDALWGAQAPTLVGIHTTTANGQWSFPVGAFAQIQARCSVTGTGTATVSINGSAGAGMVTLANPLPPGANAIGSVAQGTVPWACSIQLNTAGGIKSPDIGSGVAGLGTMRVMLATDQPALTNKLLVTPDSVALPAHQSVNLDQWNGVAPTAAAALAAGTANPTAPLLGACNELYNGATWDPQQGTVEGTALASAARTATTASADFTNYNARGVLLIVNVTAVTTSNMVLVVRAKDSISGNYARITPAANTAGYWLAMNATGTFYYVLAPAVSNAGVLEGADQFGALQAQLPRTWDINMVKGDSSSWTYSVSYVLLP